MLHDLLWGFRVSKGGFVLLSFCIWHEIALRNTIKKLEDDAKQGIMPPQTSKLKTVFFTSYKEECKRKELIEQYAFKNQEKIECSLEESFKKHAHHSIKWAAQKFTILMEMPVDEEIIVAPIMR